MASCRIEKVRTIGRSFLLHYFIVSSFWLAWITFSLSLSNLRGWFYRPSFQLAAPLETLARAAAELQLRKRTRIGNYHSVSTFSSHLACFWLSSFASTCSILLPLFSENVHILFSGWECIYLLCFRDGFAIWMGGGWSFCETAWWFIVQLVWAFSLLPSLNIWNCESLYIYQSIDIIVIFSYRFDL